MLYIIFHRLAHNLKNICGTLYISQPGGTRDLMAPGDVSFGGKEIIQCYGRVKGKEASISRALGSAQVPGNSLGQVFGDEWGSRAKASISEKILCEWFSYLGNELQCREELMNRKYLSNSANFDPFLLIVKSIITKESNYELRQEIHCIMHWQFTIYLLIF
jgi:hypothetical protein